MTVAWRAIHIDEPRLTFGHDQSTEHPKDGLFLFGPVASGQNPARMDVGVIATSAGLEKYSKWVASIEKFIDVPAPATDRKRNEAKHLRLAWLRGGLWCSLAQQAVRVVPDRRRRA
jgi:hypothetical protein